MWFCIQFLRQSGGIFQKTLRGKVKQMQLCILLYGLRGHINAQQSKSQTNAIMHLPMHALFGVIWKTLVDFGLKDANVKNLKETTDNVTKSNKCNQMTLNPHRHEIWGGIWKYTSTIVEKSQTNAINVTMLLLRLIRGYTMEKSQTNAVNAILQPHRQAFEDSFENTPKKKFNKCKQCNFASSQAG